MFKDLAEYALESTLKDYLKRKITSDWRRETEIISELLEERKDYLKPLMLAAKSQEIDMYGNHDLSGLSTLFYDFLDASITRNQASSFVLHSNSVDYPFNGGIHVGMLIPFCLQYTRSWISDFTPSYQIPIDGIEFEHWCAAQIRNLGWIAQVSKASGDQGSDIITSKNGITISIQCKRYHKPVGNKAVQEVVASKVNLKTDFGCVIATGGFTKSAITLSRSTGTILIDAEDIMNFEEYFTL
jgi:hypothetical protein